jgi:chaperonin GroES
MKGKIRPLHDRVLVKRSEDEERSPGGIYIPDNAKEKLNRGEVLAVGPGKILEDGTRAEMPVKPGDVIYFGKYNGSEVKVDGETLLVMRVDDLLGVVQ